jgi:hypothetical protein
MRHPLSLVITATVLLVGQHASAGPAPTCERMVAAMKRAWRGYYLRIFSRQLNADNQKYIDDKVAAIDKMLPVCQTFNWPARYRRCLAAVGVPYTLVAARRVPDSMAACSRAEYDHGRNRELCEPLLDHYMGLADLDFANLYADHDSAWIQNFRDTHRNSMRQWCLERGLVTDTGSACARGAKKRAEFLACGNDRP